MKQTFPVQVPENITPSFILPAQDWTTSFPAGTLTTTCEQDYCSRWQNARRLSHGVTLRCFATPVHHQPDGTSRLGIQHRGIDQANRPAGQVRPGGLRRLGSELVG